MINRLPRIADDLVLSIGDEKIKLSPRRGLKFAEDLARASFKQILVEEANKAAAGIDSRPAPRRRAMRR